MAEHMLTTTDNPFSPVTQFDEWNAYDMALGHHTLAYLARVCFTSDELSEADQAQAIEYAMDEIIEHHNGGLYQKVEIE